MEMMALDKESYPSIAHFLPFRSFHRLSEGYVLLRTKPGSTRSLPFWTLRSSQKRRPDYLQSH